MQVFQWLSVVSQYRQPMRHRNRHGTLIPYFVLHKKSQDPGTLWVTSPRLLTNYRDCSEGMMEI